MSGKNGGGDRVRLWILGLVLGRKMRGQVSTFGKEGGSIRLDSGRRLGRPGRSNGASMQRVNLSAIRLFSLRSAVS